LCISVEWGETLKEAYDEYKVSETLFHYSILSRGCKVSSLIEILQSLVNENPDVVLAEEIKIEGYLNKGVVMS
jgi:hypothetical protein